VLTPVRCQPAKSRERFEASMAFRAMPNMSNDLIIQVCGTLGSNQFVAAPNAIHSEQGAWVERHRIPQPVLPVNQAKAGKCARRMP
jgi:hypothetical protein